MKATARTGKNPLRAIGLACALTLTASTAWAQAKAAPVKLEVLVASVSTEGTQVDKGLESMARDFKRNGLAFTSYKLVDRVSLDLAEGQSGAVKLPNGKAEVAYQGKEADGKAKLKISSPALSTQISIAAGGVHTQEAGQHAGGKLFLIVKR